MSLKTGREPSDSSVILLTLFWHQNIAEKNSNDHLPFFTGHHVFQRRKVEKLHIWLNYAYYHFYYYMETLLNRIHLTYNLPISTLSLKKLFSSYLDELDCGSTILKFNETTLHFPLRKCCFLSNGVLPWEHSILNWKRITKNLPKHVLMHISMLERWKQKHITDPF